MPELRVHPDSHPAKDQPQAVWTIKRAQRPALAPAPNQAPAPQPVFAQCKKLYLERGSLPDMEINNSPAWQAVLESRDAAKKAWEVAKEASDAVTKVADDARSSDAAARAAALREWDAADRAWDAARQSWKAADDAWDTYKATEKAANTLKPE